MRWAASDVSPSSHLAFHIPNTCRVLFVLCCVLGLGGLLLCGVFGFLFCKCFGIPNSPRSLDLDDRQGLIASSAMQLKKKTISAVSFIPNTNTFPFVTGRASIGLQKKLTSFVVSCRAGIGFQQSKPTPFGNSTKAKGKPAQ